jgi:hypothetical protein
LTHWLETAWFQPLNLSSEKPIQALPSKFNLRRYIKAVEGEAHLSTGYSPILSFTVCDMDVTVNNLLRLGAVMDGPIKYPVQGKVAAFRAPDGHMLGLFEPAEGTQ